MREAATSLRTPFWLGYVLTSTGFILIALNLKEYKYRLLLVGFLLAAPLIGATLQILLDQIQFLKRGAQGTLFWNFIACSWLVNVALFGVVFAAHGGDAFTGKYQKGHYFVSNRSHYTEVSRTEFMLNRATTLAFLITGPLTILGLFKVGASNKTLQPTRNTSFDSPRSSPSKPRG